MAGARPSPANHLRDVNEQLTLATLRAQERAEASALRYRDLVEGLDAIVWEADAETWQFTFVSERAQTILGYPLERWLKEPNFFWIDLIHPEDRQQVVRDCKTAATARRDFRIDYRAVASDGRVLWMTLIARVRQQERSPVQLRGLLIDISEAKRTEKLQQLVAEIEVSEEKLKDKLEELEKFEDVVVGRELKMLCLEREVERLQQELDKLKPHGSQR